MIFDDPTLSRLLGSIEANRLVLLCGAGLSMPPPSSLMSAVRVSNECYDKYQATQVLAAPLRDDIDALAGHFHSTGEFKSVFTGSLVPWSDLVGNRNPGHAAIADLLISRAARAALSANIDVLIEQWGMTRKVAMQGALNGQEAMDFAALSNPLVKFHGCLLRGRADTVWTRAQLTEPLIADRVKTCSDWMRLQLPGKDLVVVGFWTDWGYLNDVIADALNAGAFTSVTIIDPADRAALEAKAPTLWARLTGGTANFQHLRASGADALAELRTAFSKVWMRKFYALGKPLLEAEGERYSAIDPDMTCEGLYDSRRDAEGVPYNRAAQLKEPSPQGAQASFFHHLLTKRAATRTGAWYEHGGKRIRVVHGAGQALNTVRERYTEPPGSPQPDIVVCAGSVVPAAKGKLISSGTGSSIVRPNGGGSARWMTLEEARGELGI